MSLVNVLFVMYVLSDYRVVPFDLSLNNTIGKGTRCCVLDVPSITKVSVGVFEIMGHYFY